MARKRLYPYPDADTVIGCHIMAGNISKNLDELLQIDTSLSKPYVQNLMDRTRQGMIMLGMNPNEEKLDATLELNNMIEPALKDLGITRKMIQVKFNKKEARQIFYKLGYDDYGKRAFLGDQEHLINLHYAFREGMTETLKTRITATGINPVIIDRIISRTDELYDANVRQEGAKVTARAMNNETIDFCNELYKEVIGICKIAYSFYSRNPEKRSQFSFSRTIRNMNSGSTRRKDEEEEPMAK